MIVTNETEIIRDTVEYAARHGAAACRISLNKNVMDTYTMFNGSLDKVAHCADCSVYIYLYVNGRYATFSTNKLGKKDLEDFIDKAIVMTAVLEEDKSQTLPPRDRLAKDALTGMELGLYDPVYETFDSDRCMKMAKQISIFDKLPEHGADYRVISEECEFSTSVDENYLVDSQGFEGRHIETSFGCSCEMNIEDADGRKYCDYSWASSPFFEKLDWQSVGKEALDRAISHIAPQKRRGGKYRMVVAGRVASKMVSSIFNALNASALQQKTSYLQDSLGKKIFGEGLNIVDMARTPGKAGSRLYDSEGIATKDDIVIENGVIKKYFVNTQMSNKMGIEATVEDVTRPILMPYMAGKDLSGQENNVSLTDILHYCRNGILVSGFNGGNCNPATGDFSFGVEGFAFRDGKIVHPVSEMLITGNMIELWNNFIAAGTDYNNSSRWQIPSLAFENVSFSA